VGFLGDRSLNDGRKCQFSVLSVAICVFETFRNKANVRFVIEKECRSLRN